MPTSNSKQRHLPRPQKQFKLSRRLDFLQKDKIPLVAEDAVNKQLFADVLAPTHDFDMAVDSRETFCDARGTRLPL